MIDLKKRFGSLDALEFPHPDKPPMRAERRPTQAIPRHTKGRVPVVIFALLVAAAGIGFAIEAFQTDGGKSEGPPPWDLIAIIESRQGKGPLPETAEVVLVNPVTGESTQITHAAKRGWIVRAAAWSPDGRRLAYVMGDPDQPLAFAGTWNLYVSNSDGSGQRQLTVDENLGEIEWFPAGNRIFGTFDQGRGLEIFDPERGMAGVLAEEQAGPYLSFSLSPDGDRLLYQSEVGNGDPTDLFLLDLISGERTRLTTGGGSGTPAWSPDGSMIAYRLADEIVVTPAAGGPVRHVTRCRPPDCEGDFGPSWSPDGSQLAFVRQEDGGASFQTYVVDVDGSNLHRLTSGPLDHESPAWRPHLSMRRVDGAAEPEPLVIDHITITDPLNERSQVEADVLATWPSGKFPGFHRCVFIARDQAGKEVGRYDDLVASLTPAISIRVEASAPASSMEGECGPRLDIGTPYRYVFSNVHVTNGDVLPGTTPSGIATVTFDAQWAGGGQAGAVRCRVAIMDDAGALVGSGDFNFYLAMGSGRDLAKKVEVEGTPASAHIGCAPFSGREVV